MTGGVTYADLPRPMLPRGEFDLDTLPEHVPNYSGDLDPVDATDVPRSVHMALAIAMTNVDQYMAFEDQKRDTLDALAQAWRALTPESQTVAVEYSRSATRIEVREE